MTKNSDIGLSGQPSEAVEQLKKKFREKFGRDPGPDDPLIFDPDADEPRPMPEGKLEALLAEVAVAAKLAPDLVYAIRKTGLIVSQRNQHLFSPEQLARWNAAIEKYNRLEKKPPI